MEKIIKVLILIFAAVFVLIGLRWIVDPSGAAEFLGMSMMEGLGLSSQIGDGGGLFLGLGIMMILAVVTKARPWFQAPAMILMIIAIYRTLAWLTQSAPFAVDMIAVEVVVAGLLLFGSKRVS